MRLVGIIAVFVLSVAAIVEGAALVRVSGKLDTLSEEMKAESTRPVSDSDHTLGARSASGLATDRMRPPVPKLDPKAPAPKATEQAAPEATGLLRDALATREGREELKKAIDNLKDQDRQQRVIQDVEGDVQRDNSYRERLTKTLGLSEGESGSIASIYTNLQTQRQKVIDEMRSGQKTGDQANEEIRTLEFEADRSVRGMLGEPRMRQLREARRSEALQRREQRQNAPAGQPRPQ